VDNFRPFHQASLVDHPVGDVLEEKIRIEAEEKRHRAQWCEWYHAYAFGSLIEDSYGLAAIKDIAAASSLVGAARLIVCPSFSPERFITLSFHQDGVTLDAVCGRTSLWDTGNAKFFDAGDAFRKRPPRIQFVGNIRVDFGSCRILSDSYTRWRVLSPQDCWFEQYG